MSAMDAEKALAPFPDPRAAVLHPIVNDWFDTGYEAGKLDTGVLTNRILAILPPCGHEAEIARLRKIEEAAQDLLANAEPDDDFDGQYIDWIVPDAQRNALRAAIAAGDER